MAALHKIAYAQNAAYLNHGCVDRRAWAVRSLPPIKKTPKMFRSPQGHVRMGK